MNKKNEFKSLTYNGRFVNFENLEDSEKAMLISLSDVHKKCIDNQKINDNNFRNIILKLGNEYLKYRRDFLDKNVSETELVKLEKVFNMYIESKVIGAKKDVNTMANELYFTMSVAKSERYIKDAMTAVKNGLKVKSVEKKDITNNDNDFILNILNMTKLIFEKITKHCNNIALKIVAIDDVNSLDDFTKTYIDGEIWSFDKVMSYFEILNKIKCEKEQRYTKEEFFKLIQSEKINDVFSVEQISSLKTLFEIYNLL